LIAIAAAGVYFGTDLLREPGKPDRLRSNRSAWFQIG
jgi:hypothetical protein